MSKAHAQVLTFEKTNTPSTGACISKLPEYHGLLREINLETAQKIRKEMEAAAQDIANKLKIDVSFVLTEFNQSNSLQQDVTVKFSATSSIGLDRFAKNLLTNGHKHKFPGLLYGLEFIKDNVEYVITGLDTEGERPYIRLKDANGNKLACAHEVVTYLRKKKLSK